MSGLAETPLLEVRDLAKSFPMRRSLLDRALGRPTRKLQALNGVSFSVRRGEALGVVGESGCGKSTLARCLVRLYEPDSGSVHFSGEEVSALRGEDRRRYNRRVQMIFQDPYGSLNKRMTVGQTLAEALRVHRLRPPREIPDRVRELLDLVSLPVDAAERRPHEFSGGQRQRIAIARALAVEPLCLIADEVVSALDVSVQAQVINLMLDLQDRLGLTIVFIAHDLRLVQHVSHKVAVMYLGTIVEQGETERLFGAPEHPYTAALLAAAPNLDPGQKSRVEAVSGELPSPLNLPAGCPFHPRCRYSFARCTSDRPRLTARNGAHLVACHLEPGALRQSSSSALTAERKVATTLSD